MKPELAKELFAELDARPLPTTMSGVVLGPDGTRIDPERAVLLRVLAIDTATRATVTDAVKRRGDIADIYGDLQTVHARLDTLEDRGDEPTGDTLEPTPPGIDWSRIAVAVLVGGSLALHALELLTIAWLLWRTS